MNGQRNVVLYYSDRAVLVLFGRYDRVQNVVMTEIQHTRIVDEHLGLGFMKPPLKSCQLKQNDKKKKKI